MGRYDKARDWSDTYLPEIKRILHLIYPDACLITEAPADMDMSQNTDLIMDEIHVACRVRSYHYRKYHDITLRVSSESGRVIPEYDKIMAGYGDVMFYGVRGPEKGWLRWCLIDLQAIRNNPALLSVGMRPILNRDPREKTCLVPCIPSYQAIITHLGYDFLI